MAFVVYRRLIEKEQVVDLISILDEHKIAYETSEDRESLDSLYGDKQFSHQYLVKIDASDFERADAILLELSKEKLTSVDKDHYLFGFSDDELLEILAKPDEWNEFDYTLAQQILKDRGKDVSQAALDDLKKKRLDLLAKPEEHHSVWIAVGYILAFFGGLLGIFIGWHLSTFSKTLPNGERVKAFNTNDRAHGQRIMILGLVVLLGSIILAIVR